MNKADVIALKPTQFSLGFYEVDLKIDKMKKMKPDELEKYLELRPIPVIIGPMDKIYMIDRHHLSRACWELRIEKVHVNVMSDLSHLNTEEFWDVMKKARWCHLYDQFGTGPHPEILLPENIRSMSNDPYRSLSYLLRESKVYLKQGNKVPFIEFYWANFLRKKIPYEHGHEGMKMMLKASQDLIKKDPEVKKLPGFKA